MTCLFFDENKKLLHFRDAVTSTHNRFSFKNVSLEIWKDKKIYNFEIKEENQLEIKKIQFPIHNTIICYI